MQQKEEQTSQEEDTLRYKILPLLRTDVSVNLIPLHLLQVIFQIIPYLQILKFSIDYLTLHWTGKNIPIFSYLDLSYYLNLSTAQTYSIALVASLTFMNLYWIVHILLFVLGKTCPNLLSNFRKLIFIFTKNVLLLPLLNIVINVYNCDIGVTQSQFQTFRTCFFEYSTSVIAITVISFVLFFLFLLGQTFFNFDFLSNHRQFHRLRRSCFTAIALMSCLVLNQLVAYFLSDLVQLIILDISSVFLGVLILLKDEQLNQTVKLIEISFLGVLGLSLIMVNIVFFTNQNISILLFCLLSLFLVSGLMQVRTYSLKFQLENINKWPTPDIMIRYSSNLRYYLSRRNQYIFKVYIHGYMQVHRQKCDSPTCPSRRPLSQSEKKLFESGELTKTEEEILRCENLIKSIFGDGYRLTPISAQIQLQNAIFLYERKQKELALKNLLLIKYQELSLDKYYRYYLLKDKIHQERMEEPNRQFLDLVSELQVKREEHQILKKFEKAAIVNLQFWSVLNEDHPDFQKLNEIGSKRIQIRQQVKDSYDLICRIAHSEKVTSLYVNYLQTIENDEAMYNSILSGVKQEYGLNEKIVLQDWANSSNSIILVSIEDTNYGTIIDVNSSCAALFGYQRYQILNRLIKMLFVDELTNAVKEFLSPCDNQQTFYLVHKSGYVLKIKRRAQNYNSMQTGMASIITISLQLSPTSCFFLVGKSSKIIGISASVIPLLGLELKSFETEVMAENFFHFQINQLPSLIQQKAGGFIPICELIKDQFENEIINYTVNSFRLSYEQYQLFHSIQLISQFSKIHSKQQILYCNFQFQVQATLHTFKYFGNIDNNESYLSQFSQLYRGDTSQQDEIVRDFGTGISTLRLRQNIIQVIQQNQQDLVNKFEAKGIKAGEQFENISRKHEEQIFQSKSAFQKFISDYKLAKFNPPLMAVRLIVLMTLYIVYYIIFTAQNNSIMSFTSEIAYQNLIIGSITKQLSLMKSLSLIAINQSNDTPSRFTNIYNDNIQYLQSIKLQGSNPYYMDVSLGNSTQSFLTDQFLLSFISYSLNVLDQMNANMSMAQLAAIYQAADPYAVNYLTVNSAQVKQIMIKAASDRQATIDVTISNYIAIEVLMLIFGIIFVIVYAILIVFNIHNLNLQRVQIFEIFLDITEIQIQQFSSKTEKFLLSLHVEDTNGDIDVDEEIQNTKKINSSTFAKKKRFKLIKFNKSIYLRVLISPLCASAFFIHSFLLSYINLEFQSNSHHYFFQTSVGDYQFFSGLAKVQDALLTNSSLPTSLSQTYLQYYHNYFNLHYNSFGQIDDFHAAFTDIFMLDICNGMQTAYGSSKIASSCQVPLLYPNGSYLVFTDTAMRTQYLTNFSSLSYSHLVCYEVLSKTHRLLTQNLLQAQSILISSTLSGLMTCLLIWILVIIAVSVFYGIPLMKQFVDEIKQIKNILSILPISVAKQLPLARRYFNKILKSGDCYCCSL